MSESLRKKLQEPGDPTSCWRRHTDGTQRLEVEVACERLSVKIGRLQIELDAVNGTGLILMDGERFPVERMTLDIVAGLPARVTAEFNTFGIGELPEKLQREFDACRAGSR